MNDDVAIALLLLVMLMSNQSPSVVWGAGWVWPVPGAALVSQEFRRPDHLGVDIMFRVGGRWVAPPGTHVLAAKDGVVWSTGETARGHNVVLDHGPPFATFYQHLETVAVSRGQAVKAGDVLGTMGADPTDPQGLRHLHFAVWYKGNGDKASVDPQSDMGNWRRVA
jgi:murein DD-endopeptidase MepM/ murein hydrolase activator NlpD